MRDLLRRLPLVAAVAALACLAGCESSGGGSDVSSLRPTAQESLRPSYAEGIRDQLAGQKSMTQTLMDSSLLGEQVKQFAGQAAGQTAGGFLESLASWFK